MASDCCAFRGTFGNFRAELEPAAAHLSMSPCVASSQSTAKQYSLDGFIIINWQYAVKLTLTGGDMMCRGAVVDEIQHCCNIDINASLTNDNQNVNSTNDTDMWPH
ncbi:hypothetical protein CBL_02482 [Carabus blaptoides fortunei]